MSAGRGLRATRLRRQALSGPPLRSPSAVCERILAVQAQDRRGFRLAVRARTRGLVASDVNRAVGSGEVVVDWLCRRTLHLVRREDHGWLHALTAPAGGGWSVARLAQLGLTAAEAERGADAVVHELRDGPVRRRDLRERLVARGVRAEGQILIHLIALASYRGDVVRGPWAGAEQAFVLRRDWLGEPERVDRDAALAELARRYLAGHGPASDRDLARWSGLGLRDVRAGLRDAGAADAGNGLLDLPGARGARALPGPRLLGPFDPVLHGWPDRSWVTAHAMVAVNGIFHPCALLDGRVVAMWRGDVELEPLEEFDAAVFAAEAADVRRFLAR